MLLSRIQLQVEEMYMSNSRNDMNGLLSKLMLETIVAPVLTPDRLISEHMMLIAILHANVGTEVGAHFLLTVVKKFHQMLNEYHCVENKELDNIILIISHLYNFKVKLLVLYACHRVFIVLFSLGIWSSSFISNIREIGSEIYRERD